MQTQLWNPWSIFDELERTVFAAAGSPEWPVFDIEDSDNETTLTADLPAKERFEHRHRHRRGRVHRQSHLRRAACGGL